MQELFREPLTIVIGLVVIAILLGLLVWRRRSAGHVPPPSRAGSERELGNLVASFEQSHPAFASIMKSFQQRHSLRYLCRHKEVESAFAELSREAPSPAAKPSLRLQPGKPNRSREAAMVTIVRAIYEDDRYYRELPVQTHRELDNLLDALTRADKEEV